ncbi:MAG: hypothetical protein P1V51_21295 [Deltaproteobacteria bacterium]|nr:hypothetical protein [Deltaproteobacteria bacterium]
MRILLGLLGVLVTLLMATVPTAALAQKKKVIRLEEITVEGRIQKPQAFYILPRSNLDYEALDRKESFLQEIDVSLEKDPF